MLKKFFQRDLVEAGCDEAGRGCLAGPVFAAAVILPLKFFHPLLNDSKQMTEEERDELRPIIERDAITWAVAQVNHRMIDRINILKASILAMHKALDQLQHRPQFILVDGNRFKKYKSIPHQCIIEGDAKFSSIAAASVLAKTHRDEYMKQLHESFPHYNWKRNKGYATEEHRQQISIHGICEHHRKTFRLFYNEQPELFSEEIIPSL
ncbi:MAG TPA: ribonuclease HII [Chitinophagales bacterium]|nr:ribonuclease HII [Chitinophagales bacterium]